MAAKGHKSDTFKIIFFFSSALVGVIFVEDEEAAYSNYRVWESLGFIIAYVLQTQVCIFAKLWVALGFLIVGMAGYLTIEYLLMKRRTTPDGELQRGTELSKKK